LTFKKPLARQLLFWILLSSSILTLLITCFHFYLDYRDDLSAIDSRLQQIESSYLSTLASALWSEDLTQLEVQVTGIKNLPEVALVRLTRPEKLLFSQGDNLSQYTKEGRWPVTYDFAGGKELLGELYVVIDLLPVYQQLGRKALLTLATQGAKTFIVSLIIFFIVYYLVTRHLSQITHSMASFEITDDHSSDLTLDRHTQYDDELGYLVDEYNKKNKEISTAFLALTEQKQKAETVNRIKSEFLANMSHEVKTPMNGVYGMTQLLMETDLNSEQQEYINVIKNSSEHMLALLNNILDFSKIEANKIELDLKPFQLSLLLNEVVQLFQTGADEKKLILSSVINNNLDDTFIGDSVRLKQILVNLLSNALKFTTYGAINIKVEVTPLQSEPLNCATLTFSVTDSGIGIPKDKQSKIFEQFTQADSSTTRHYGGTGLGLSICDRLVSLMGGELKIINNETVGSCFYFSLTLELGGTETATKNRQEQRTAGNEREVKKLTRLTTRTNVLLVEDSRINQQVCRALLKDIGCDVVIANNGKEAIQNWHEQSIDIILMDCHMPVMDGFEATVAIRQAEAKSTTPVPIIAVSASNGDEDKKRCLAVGMNGFIEKPYIKDVLYKTIREQLLI
jgi:signal transduction histidine kinase/FixJ family two-component response regulator